MFEEILSKILWLKKNTNQAVLIETNNMALNRFQDAFSHNTVPKRVLDLLALDTVYCLLRNSKWIGVPLFQEILSDYLICNFSLERDTCESLVPKLCSDFLQFIPCNDMEILDQKEFLRYLFISSSFGDRENDSIDRFGFGSSIFKRIKNAIEISQDMSRDETQGNKARFIADIDAGFIEVIFDICEEYKDNPLAIDLQKLSFLLSDANPTEKVLLHKLGLEKLVHMIAMIGSRRSCTFSEMQRYLACSSEECSTLVHLLCSHDLIYPTDHGSQAGKVRYALSDLGFEIAAPAFANSFWQKDSVHDFEKVFRIPGAYQEAVIKCMPQAILPKILGTTNEQLRSLSPRAFSVLLNIAHHQEFALIAEQLATRVLISESLNSWLRKEACFYLSRHCHTQDVRQLLQNVAESDASAAVKDAALFGLTNGIQDPGRTR